MNLFRFIIGILGALLVLGAFGSFLPLAFLGGISTGSIAIAFGLPIALIILGSTMVYFGFYYKEPTHQSNAKLTEIIKWCAIYSLAVLVGKYVLKKIIIFNYLAEILILALIISIVVQIVKSHESNFKLKWFIFYFFVYTNLIWIVEKILPATNSIIIYSITLGIIIGGITTILQKIKIQPHAVPWAIVVLILLLAVANMDSIGNQNITNIVAFNTNTHSNISEAEQACPTTQLTSSLNEASLTNLKTTQTTLTNLIDSTIWQVENLPGKCYRGKYVNQNPYWFYCDDMILSRWEMSSSGTIRYRRYTAVTSVWQAPTNDSPFYQFNGFICENGQKVTVEKGVTNYYVYDTREGSQIKIKY